jgi:sulfur carrier protein|tara:strand:+ start:83 stop:280 length:198 start_codon:yes stop_codon:yes gene_type:complete
MKIFLNGDVCTIEQKMTIEKLISSLDIEGKFAIEINQHIIPRSKYADTSIHLGDNIEIVQAIGGG